MAGSIMVRYAQKTYKQQKAEYNDSSVDIIPESMSIMTFNTRKEANKFAEDMIIKGYHIIEIKDDYKKI
jgi:hypothetical protein